MAATSETDNVSVREGSHWPEIIAAAQDPQFLPEDFTRLILSEMALVSRELGSTSEHSSLQFKIKPLLAEIQALRSMAQTAHDIPDLMAESDVVNLGGPKFDYIVVKFFDVVETAVKDAFPDNLLSTQVIRTVGEQFSKLCDQDFPRALNDPQVLMEYREEKRRKMEERKKNQSMYPRYPPSHIARTDGSGKTESKK